MAIKTSSAKAKGRNLQQWVRDKIIELLSPYGVVAEDVKSTAMGQSGVDVQLSPFTKQFLPIAVECKSHKSFAVYSIMDQALSNSGQGEQPVVVLKADRKKPLVVIDAEYYFELEGSRVAKETS